MGDRGGQRQGQGWARAPGAMRAVHHARQAVLRRALHGWAGRVRAVAAALHVLSRCAQSSKEVRLGCTWGQGLCATKQPGYAPSWCLSHAANSVYPAFGCRCACAWLYIAG